MFTPVYKNIFFCKMNHDMIIFVQQFATLLRESPCLWYSDKVACLRNAVEYATITQEDHDEEGLPPDPPVMQESAAKRVKQAKTLLEKKRWRACIDVCNNIIKDSPNYASAFRVRAEALYMDQYYDEAYLDMCEAQKIDYDEEYESLQTLMKGKIKSGTPNASAHTSPETAETANLLNGINFQQVFQNPQFMDMASK